ncbi:AMP-binding protein [Dehalococcoidia bacterium]|nr:AMP-binding protein [Dehalococcoidia bacterium]
MSLILSVTKGLELPDGKRMSQILQEELPLEFHPDICSLSGPNLAKEIVNSKPASTVVAGSRDISTATIQDILMSPTFRVYTSSDLVGLELCGTLKNILAIGVGIADGLNMGDNGKSTLITRGLSEIRRLGVAAGGEADTFYGLAGLGDIIATCSSPFSRNRYVGALMFIQAGSKMILTEIFDPEQALRLIEQEKITMLHGFDTHFYDLTNHPNCSTTDRSSLRTGLFASGMASSVPVAEQAQRLLCPTITGWGMTECGVGVGMSFLDSPFEDRCAGSGYPLPGYEFKIINPETGLSVPPNNQGELCVRGYAIMEGYYKKPQETAEAVDQNGWLHTGDVATLREDGYLRFFGRYKDMLKVGGENVDPIEVEAFLINHPSIKQVQIVGVPDPRLSETPCACVILEEGHQLNQIDIDLFCRGKLASFKIPNNVLILQDFPMTSSGKIQKFVLREITL